MTAMVVRNSNRSTLPQPSWPISVRGEGNGGWAGLRWRWFTIHDDHYSSGWWWWWWWLAMMIIVIVMISDDGFDNWWKVRKWKSTTRIWILIKQSFHPVHLPLSWFYLQLFRNFSFQKDTMKRVVMKVWNLWFAKTSKVQLRFALQIISCTTRAEMIRVASPWHIFRKSMNYELWSFEVLNRSFNLNFERWYFNIFHNRLEVHFSKTYIHENRGQHSSVDNFHFFGTISTIRCNESCLPIN